MIDYAQLALRGLNSRPLVALPHVEDSLVALTPGHFLVDAPIKAVPDGSGSDCPMPLSRRWSLCQALTQHLWKRWSVEYLDQLNRFAKWHQPSRNVQIGDIVCICGEQTPSATCTWPLAIVESVHPGADGRVHVVVLHTSKGTYKRPITKIVLLVYVDTCTSQTE